MTDNLKHACKEHFSSEGLMKKGTVVDILAGEQGPSCTELTQIPDLKVIQVRFIPRNNDSDYSSRSMHMLSGQGTELYNNWRKCSILFARQTSEAKNMADFGFC